MASRRGSSSSAQGTFLHAGSWRRALWARTTPAKRPCAKTPGGTLLGCRRLGWWAYSRPNLRLLARRAWHTADSLLDRVPPSAIALAIYAAFLVGASLVFAWMVEDYVTSDPLVQWDARFARWLHLHSSQPCP